MASSKRKPSPVSVSIVGSGNLGTALALGLTAAGVEVRQIAARAESADRRRSAALARKVRARLVVPGRDALEGDIIWITVPDDKIAGVAELLAEVQPWKGKIVFHSSGALSSDELSALRARGAKVASVHPMMTFVRTSIPEMTGVAFAIEGDTRAVGVARALVKRLGASAFTIAKEKKILYHAFGSFASPMVIALMVSLEQVAQAAGIRRQDVKPIMVPLLLQTLSNYLKHDAAAAFSGPIARGDVETVRKHLAALRPLPESRAAYKALALAAMKLLPGKSKPRLKRELGK